MLREKTVEIALKDGGKRTVSADQIFINTGTRASVPKLEGLDTVAFLDNVSIMELDKVPERLMILGGGYIGLEFAQMFRRFGSEVSIVHRGRQLLDREDEDIAKEIQSIFAEDGITVHLNAMASKVSKVDDDISLTFTADNATKTIKGSHLLIATGRKPNTDMLNPGAAKIETDERGFIRANERLETSAPDVFVIGDVKGGPAFTHISYDDFRILKGNLLDGRKMSTANRMVPYTVFIDPQLGRIGLTENEARQQGQEDKDCSNANDACGARVGDGGGSRSNEGGGGCGERSDSRCRNPGDRGRRDRIHAANCNDGEAELFGAKGRHLLASHIVRGAEQRLQETRIDLSVMCLASMRSNFLDGFDAQNSLRIRSNMRREVETMDRVWG